ncbi:MULTISPECIES: protein kinase domain-containing protein [Pseudomonas chlororaphis group]|uniref:protein kinase domain-containing protein n=1 Tax=Pseudomonas chlororaphis group TaxID=136842 RepID=UPI002098423F|nr:MULTISPECIES: protein kinase [Pseudomonas chlororaphis group]MCO7580241.1 protein kinase [Pseudomonas protegens]MCO7586292.1 protein kinase [Pseudomonas chlororaphis]MCO7603398.1 protein kinase [Pseudomonas chlororaphis]
MNAYRRKVKFPSSDQLNGWEITKRIGGGGNGEVFRLERNGQFRALKILHRGNKIDKDRFQDEIEAMRRCAGIDGVLPVFESSSDLEQPDSMWFMTGLATELMAKLGHRPELREVVDAVCGYSAVLASIHELDVSHRDIKPENLFFYEGRWTVGDFGLASFKGKKAVTATRGKLGPMFYLAPEMFNDVKSSNGKSVDVYSLAKTLWKLSTGQQYPLPGSYTPAHLAFRIGSYLPGQVGSAALDQLIAAATAFKPSDRPSMAEFTAELKAWLAPRVEKSMPIKIDIGQHLALLEDLHLNEEVEREHLARQAQANEEAVARAIETLSPFMADLQHSVSQVSDKLGCNLNRGKNGSQLVISIPGEEKATLDLAVEVNTASHPMITTSARIALHWRTGAGLKLLLWSSEAQYLGAGSEEANKLHQLCDQIAIGLRDSLQDALELSFSRRRLESEQRVYRFQIDRQSGIPADGARVHLLSADGITLETLSTSADGLAECELTTHGAVVAFISHSECQSTTLVGFGQDNKVTLNDQPGAFSRVQKTSWAGIQEMVGQFSLIHDGSQRMYMYAKEFSVDGGATGAIYLALGKKVHIKDKNGMYITLTPRSVIGDCYILDFQRITE